MADYCQTACQEAPRCVGLQLGAYSVGHHILLRGYDSGFLRGKPTYQDLILGVFICSQTWRGWQEWKSSWKFPVALKLWGWVAGRFDIPKQAELFAAYIANGEECPEINVPDDARTLVGAWESRLVRFLTNQMKLSHEAAMDYPLALAWHDYCAWAEEEGRIKLLSEADKATIAYAKSDRFQELAREAAEAGRRELEEMKARAMSQKEGSN